MTKIVIIGIGSNMGNKKKNIGKAIKLMKEKCKLLKLSSLYKTEPVGYKKQDWFLNCAAKIKTELKPDELLKFFRSIEKILGRVKRIKNGPRTIDLDILFYGDEIIKTKKLIVPHPRLHKRLFVLEPLKEIAPDFMHPVIKKNIKELNQKLKNRDGVELYKQN